MGGGPIGLTGSNLLSHHGVEHLLVNRRPATSDHPRARFMDMRTLEILRKFRLADAVIDTGVPPEWVPHVRYSTTLAARRHDAADIRFGTDLVALSQDLKRVTAVIRDMHNGETETVTADYVIGAFGRHSTVRELIGGDLMEGFSQSGLIQDVLFHADLSRWVRDRIGALLFVFHPMGYGWFQPVDAKTRWRVQSDRTRVAGVDNTRLAGGLYATDETVLVRPDAFVAARFIADAEVTETQLRDVTMAV